MVIKKGRGKNVMKRDKNAIFHCTFLSSQGNGDKPKVPIIFKA